MDNFNILVYDSGIGGLNVFKRLNSSFPWVNFYYLSDSKNTPYGAKSKDELLKRAKECLSLVGLENFSAVVLGCNTLSTQILDELEDFFKIKFFGVKPPIKNLSGKTLLLATKGTANSPYIKYERQLNENLTVFSPSYLVEEIEKNAPYFNNVSVDCFLPKFSSFFDNVILGCTHFIFVKNQIQKIFPNAKILDGIDDVSGAIFDYFENFVGFLTTVFDHPVVTKVNFLKNDQKRNFWLYKSLFLSN